MKECKKCFMQIDTRATICPHCKLSQRFWGHPSAGDLVAIIALVVFACFIAYTKYADAKKENVYAEYTELKASVLQVNTYKAFDAVYFVCLGEISNPTNHDFSSAKYEVTLFNSKGDLVDVSNPDAANINIPANGKAHFRISSVATNPEAEYSKCNVKITKASNK